VTAAELSGEGRSERPDPWPGSLFSQLVLDCQEGGRGGREKASCLLSCAVMSFL